MKRFSDAIWTGIFGVIFLLLYYLVPALHTEYMLNGFYILLGGTIAYLSVALKKK